jgi:hypothetical protein
MRFIPLTGSAQVVHCQGCQVERTGGDLNDCTASGRPLDVVYKDSASNSLYCESCVSKLVYSVDFTRSVNHFYMDTRGEVIR